MLELYATFVASLMMIDAVGYWRSPSYLFNDGLTESFNDSFDESLVSKLVLGTSTLLLKDGTFVGSLRITSAHLSSLHS